MSPTGQAAPITLACLDMAGTTVRDDGAVEAAFLAALDHCGIGPDDPRRPGMLDYVRATMGTSKITVFRALFPEEAEAVAANAAFESTYETQLSLGGIEPIAGAQETIAALRAAGVRVALLTGFSATTRDALVETLGWQQVADLFVCPAEAGRGRPYPDMVLTALMRLRIDGVHNVAVVGDTAADIESGLRAGAACVAGVLTGADDRGRLLAAGAPAILDSIVDLPALIGRLQTRATPTHRG